MASKSNAGSKAADMIRVSVSEAAKLFGLSPQTIRRAIKDQEIRYVVVRGRYRIAFESVLDWSQRQTTTRNKLERHGIGQYVDHWRIRNKLYSPNPHMLSRGEGNARETE
ncbi:helix-turn-helix domain-containing protein [Candidatus Uhrbacteria bacterium]|nr:helix-turn-helix domain-containing protein [Candidatus Uhrbacteria bacterium]